MNHKLARPQAFTLIELLVVISIIALLIGILLPALGAARKTARASACLSNIRQLGIALQTYAADYKGKFPPSNGVPAATGGGTVEWHDLARIGYYLPQANVVGGGTGPNDSFGGTVFICPSDVDGAARCYGMNAYASSAQGGGLPAGTPTANAPGTYFDASVIDSSNVLMLAENWSQNGSGGLFYSNQVVGGGPIGGDLSRTAALWFGANGGQGRALPSPRFSASPAPSIIDYTRHGDVAPNVFGGRANFAFADGHAASVSTDELVRADGKSTLAVMWSPLDKTLRGN